ncbi:MAG: hypothetical protein QG622_1328 [Actinomycetota bacterium]|nr:hypothetical protein [Actinomycetota bacterium]
MPGPILHAGSGLTCPHGVPAQVTPGSPRVLVSGMPVATMTDTYPVTGCPFQIPVGAGTKPSPCLQIRWTVPATRVMVNGSPVVTAASTGSGVSPESAPQGPPVPAGVQVRVVAS